MALSRPSLRRFAVPLLTCMGLLAALAARLSGAEEGTTHTILMVTLVVGLVPLVIEVMQSIIKGRFGIDLIAIVAIVTALTQGEALAGSVIVLMLSGGEALEEYALRRARRNLSGMLSAAPQSAHIKDPDGAVRDVPIDSVQPGTVVIVKPGEVIPVDGTILAGTAMVDESALTGEPLPTRKTPGLPVMSGSVARDGLLELRADRPSSESKYARIIRLIEEAEEKRAPFVRLADRESVWFTAATFVIAGGALLLTGDATRMLSVLVVATPCPLILAAPIAFIAGISRAAGRGIIVRSGEAIEKLSTAHAMVFDKTGTLTIGLPAVTDVDAPGDTDATEVLRIAASLDQLSAHVLARSLVAEAHRRSLTLSAPTEFSEAFGEGVSGVLDGVRYVFGRLSFVRTQGAQVTPALEAAHDRTREEGRIVVYLAADSNVIGSVHFSDTIRSHAGALITRLRQTGVERVKMLTGDKHSAAVRIAREIGLAEDDVQAECLPEDKVAAVEELKKTGIVVMVGDGINDAPALAAADVGIALGGGSSTASSEAGDIVILVDDIGRITEALDISRRVMTIARQSISVGIGLSILLMGIAAFGFVPPVAGALLQEAIDVGVILNALRVLIDKRVETRDSRVSTLGSLFNPKQ